MPTPTTPSSLRFHTRRSALWLLAAGLAAPALAAESSTGPSTVSVRLPTGALLVHINQVGLERLGPKQAIVEARGPVGPGRYRVLSGGRVLAQGALSPLPAFTDWGAGKHYYAADFSALQSSGSYRVEVTLGGRRALSPPVQVQDQALFSLAADKILEYFRLSRHTGRGDRHLRIFETERRVDVWGGWKDAGGDSGKYLSHLGYANFFNPQQTSLVAWVLAYTAHTAPALYRSAGLQTRAEDEAFWGADYLHRILDPEGYFYTTVFDKWGAEGAERMVVGYEGEDGRYTSLYRSAYRAGGGLAIAALARAAMLAESSTRQGLFSGATYLADARRAFDHLQRFNPGYGADGVENIIDDYGALMAAVELFNATQEAHYLDAARERAGRLMARQTAAGGFIADGGSRPFYHAVEAGLPALSLAQYLRVEKEPARRERVAASLRASLRHELAITNRVANPYGYARQSFQLSGAAGRAEGEVLEGFFIPHRNETGYWWQGESARLASQSTAMVLAGRQVAATPGAAFGIPGDWAAYAQAQLDWTLGRNPYGISMLYGFGQRNPPAVPSSAGDMFAGGISNGITGAPDSESGRGIAFAPGPDDAQWRWVEQWLPHSAWMLLAAVSMAQP